jgi:hypothetical protein
VYNLSANPAILNLNQNLTSLSAGRRYRPTTDSTQDILLFRDTASNTQLKVQYQTGGTIAVLRNTTGLDNTSAGLISLNTWYWIEMAATIDNTTGSVTVKIYDDSLTLLDTLSFSGDTQNTANAFANHVLIAGTNDDNYADDIWISSTNALYGPLRVETIYPTGNGDTHEWTRAGTDSGTDWGQVDEAQDNGTTDYLESATNGKIHLFTFPARSLTGAIHAVQVVPTLGLSGAVGGMTLRAVCRIGGVNYVGSTVTLSNAFKTYPFAWGTNPSTSAAWDDAGLASAQFGIERVAGTESTVFEQLTQCVIEVVSAA